MDEVWLMLLFLVWYYAQWQVITFFEAVRARYPDAHSCDEIPDLKGMA
jgi:hypothetical protein